MADDIVTVYAFMRKGDAVLLQKRQNTGFGDGFYSLVGGHVDGKENARDALIREVREEVGVLVSPEDMCFKCFLHRNTPNGVFLNFFYEVKKWEGAPRICEPHKAADLRFFPVNELPTNTLDYIQYAINCVEKRQTEGYLGWKSTEPTIEASGSSVQNVPQKPGAPAGGSINGGPC